MPSAQISVRSDTSMLCSVSIGGVSLYIQVVTLFTYSNFFSSQSMPNRVIGNLPSPFSLKMFSLELMSALVRLLSQRCSEVLIWSGQVLLITTFMSSINRTSTISGAVQKTVRGEVNFKYRSSWSKSMSMGLCRCFDLQHLCPWVISLSFSVQLPYILCNQMQRVKSCHLDAALFLGVFTIVQVTAEGKKLYK